MSVNLSSLVYVLPNLLPYRVIEKKAEFSEVPGELRHKIKFEVYKVSSSLLGSIPASSPDFSVTITMPELAGKRITLSYIPATQDDAAIIEEYGGITNVPAYLVEMKPVLRVEGEAVAVGSPVILGETQQFVMQFITPGGERDRVSNYVTVGAYYAVGLDLGKVPVKLLEERKAKLTQWEYLTKFGLVKNVSQDMLDGEILYITALTYFMEVDLFDELLAKADNVFLMRQPSEAMTGMYLSVSYLFWSPYKVNFDGIGIDVDKNIHVVLSKNKNRNVQNKFMIKSGMMASALEHGIIQQFFEIPAVSAIKIIYMANIAGIPVYKVNKTNIDNILPRLQVSDDVKLDISNAIAQNRVVIIPERNIKYYNWTGVGYIVLDPDTGAGAYMISGGIAGGQTAILLAECLLNVLAPFIPVIKGKLGKLLDAISTGKSIVEVLTDFTPAGAIAFVYGMLILPFLLAAAGAPLFFIVFHAIIWGWIFAIAESRGDLYAPIRSCIEFIERIKK